MALFTRVMLAGQIVHIASGVAARVEQMRLAQIADVLASTVVERAAVNALLVVALGRALARRSDRRELFVLRVDVGSNEQTLVVNEWILY